METQKAKEVNPIGMIRQIDILGRVVIPKEFREALEWEIYDKVEILAFEDGTVLLRKFVSKT